MARLEDHRPDDPGGGQRPRRLLSGGTQPLASSTASLPTLPVVTLRGVRLHAVSERECVAAIVAELRAGRGGWVYTPNIDHLRRQVASPGYARLCSTASLVVADGMPLIWASRLQGTPLPERVAGSDLVSSLAEAAAANGRSLFLLGGNPGAADGAAQALRSRYRGLDIRGTLCPPRGFLQDPAQMQHLTEVLLAARPDIVYIGIGTPMADQLVERLRPMLPGTWWLTIGISLSFLSGDVLRAPRWMQRSGLEWLYRLWREPKRLSFRYLVLGVPFAVSLLAGSAATRVWRAGPEAGLKP